MSYIVLNGQKSTLVKGLLIQSLPPISKPLIRAQYDEIDGRDGDIVTKLGYAAYDKTVKIGLYNDFDINEVISYFDNEGTVIFSNEEDKYYYFQTLEQIDFERLLRYRIADVKFHVQPFKYSAVEKELTKNYASGDTKSFSVINSGNTSAKPAITIYGSGTINLSLNGAQILIINLGDEEYITIDSAAMEASKDGVLKNRLITGNYDYLSLQFGQNVFSWTGDVTSFSISNYSRWI